MQSLDLSQFLNSGGEGLMQRLLIVGRLCDPENIVVLFGIDVPNMAGNDVVFVAGRTFERQFAFDCHPAAIRIKGGEVGADVVLGLSFVWVCSCFAVTIDKRCPTKPLAGDADLLE